MQPDAVQRENKPLECRVILFGARRSWVESGDHPGSRWRDYTALRPMWGQEIKQRSIALIYWFGEASQTPERHHSRHPTTF